MKKLERPLSERFDNAFLLAHKLHRTDPRKDTQIPYVAHLLAVASVVLEYGGDEEMAVAALLHDAVEDHNDQISIEDIESQFGARVAQIVRDCSDSMVTPKEPWEPRKKAYLARISTMTAESRLVCAADKLHNATAILRDFRNSGDAVFKRFNGGKDGTLWYQRQVTDALTKAGETALTTELNRVVTQLEKECQAHGCTSVAR